MDEDTLTTETLESYHYDVTSAEFYQDVKTFIYKQIETLRESLIEEATPNDIDFVQKNINKVIESMLKDMQEPLKKLQEETCKILEVPRHLFTIKKYTDDDLTDIKREIELLELQYRQERVFLRHVEQESEFLKTTMHELLVSVLFNHSLNPDASQETDLINEEIEKAYNTELQKYFQEHFRFIPLQQKIEYNE